MLKSRILHVIKEQWNSLLISLSVVHGEINIWQKNIFRRTFCSRKQKQKVVAVLSMWMFTRLSWNLLKETSSPSEYLFNNFDFEQVIAYMLPYFVESQTFKKENCALRSSCPEVFYKKLFLEISQNSQENTCAYNFTKKPQPTTLLKRDWHRCFPVNFGKFLGTLFLQNTSGGCL